jgi:TolB-like protein/DNA-binding winged helix-turn-helix (wHTH) protein/cytochrome c-type biogenesis protein CcmH/NrfG
MTSPVGPVVRFRDFELDASQYELRRLGRRVKLGRQPMDLLILLVQRPGQLVTRADIAERLWGPDVFVDVETGVNTAISKVRQALHDTAERAEYVETVAGRGYRFIAPIEPASAPAPAVSPSAPPAPGPAEPPPAAPPAPGPAEPVAAGDTPAQAVASRTAWHPFVAASLLGVVAAAIALALWWPPGRTATAGIGAPAGPASIAVLPFANTTHDAEQDYLALGLTDEVTASLAQIDPGRLVVKGRTAGYRGSTKTALEIGQELGVDYLLEGAMLAEQGHVRVTATLIRVRDQEHVWSQAVERQITSALSLQQDVSGTIAAQIRARLSPDAAGVAVSRQTAVPDAYDAYLRGRYLQNRRTPEGNRQAIAAYRRAIALDPNYALAWASLSFTYAASVINADARPAEMAPLAREAAEHAIRANPDLAEAQFVAGYVNWVFDWDWPAAERRLRRAIALDPGAAGHHRVLGHILSQMGRAREADAALARAAELDALDPLTPALWSQVAFQRRDAAAAIGHARDAIRLDATFWIGHMELGQAYVQTRQDDLALEALADAARLSGGNSKAISLRGYVLARAGRLAEAREVVRVLEARSKERYVPPYAFALVQAGLGDRASALAWLEKAYAEHDVHLIYLPVDDKWDPYRGDPAFEGLLARGPFTPAPR